ncbi:MAG: aminopeptidase, partial [Coprobacillus sp.]
MNEYIIDFLKNIMAIDSPSGYTKEVISYCEREANRLGYKTEKTNKGNLEIFVDGKDDYTVGFCAHVDTLGLMVRSLKSDGTLSFTNVGGPIVPTLDGEYCRILTRNHQTYTGTILSNSPAAHVYKDAKSLERDCDTMHIRLDEMVKNQDDVKNLGIQNGDYIAIDTKTTITDSGFIKSRFLDDKMSVAILFGMLKTLKENNITPQ